MRNNSVRNSSSASAIDSRPSTAAKGWFVPIVCAFITALGVAYTAYSSHKAQSEIESLKAASEQQVAKIKADMEYQIAQAELRSKENILRLTSQLDAEKELRAKAIVEETAAISSRSRRCAEIKNIRDGMSRDLAHFRHNDPLIDEALSNLDTAVYKKNSYLTKYGLEATLSAMPKEKSPDAFVNRYEFYRATMEGYNAELRAGCTN